MAHFSLSLAHNHWVPAAVFLATYLLIAIESGRGSHLDRTAAAFCGAVVMVLAGVVTLDEAYRTIDWNTLLFLLGMMILVAHFQISGLFDWIAGHVALIARTRFELLVILAFTSGILSAFFVNDTMCLILTPIVLTVTDRLQIPPLPYLIALAVSSNAGSVMSVTGNPQNALVGISAHFSFLGFLGHLAPVAALGLCINIAVLAIFFRSEILRKPLGTRPRTVEVALDKVLLSKCCLAAVLVVALWVLGYSFPLVAVSVGAFILVIGRVKAENVYQRIDWELLLFFASLFVVVSGFQRSGAVDYLIADFHHALEGRFASQLFAVSGMMLILSNLVSNVPAVLLFRPLVPSFPNSHFIWLIVASTSTLAGNATPLSSVANLIVLQQSSKRVQISFWQFARVGMIITVLTTLAAIGVLALEHRWFPGS
jgi:Na+/H+ antiporter NhaD/arsenite permease-like protein